MKILFAADGSKYTKKALAFLVTHEALAGSDGEVVVIHVQIPVPPRARAMLGGETVTAYYRDEADKVLAPIERFLARHDLKFRTRRALGHPGQEIVRAARREKAHLIVMGTHGRGLVGRALMGSVAQNVVADAEVPVLLVK